MSHCGEGRGFLLQGVYTWSIPYENQGRHIAGKGCHYCVGKKFFQEDNDAEKPSLSDHHHAMTAIVSRLNTEAEEVNLLKIFPVLFWDIKILVVELCIRAGLFDAGVTDLISAFFPDYT